MNTKELIKIINEEIERFDYLGRDVKEASDAKNDIINSKEFKIGFVDDILKNNTNSIKFIEVVGSKKENNDPNDFNVGKSEIYYEIHLFYEFNGDEHELTLLLEGKNVNSEPDIDLKDIDVILTHDDTGEEIDLDWLKSNEEMYSQFIKSLMKNDFKDE